MGRPPPAAGAPPSQAQINSGRVLTGATIADLETAMGVTQDSLYDEIYAFNAIARAVNALLEDYGDSTVLADRMQFANIDPLDTEQFNTNPNQAPPFEIFPGFAIPNTTRRTYRELLTGPFFAVEIIPTVLGTFGGVRTDYLTSRVFLDGSNTNFVPGLYAVGENANRNFFGYVYLSGSATTQAVMTGRAAAQHAATFVDPDRRPAAE